MTKNMVRLGDICTVVSGTTPKTSVSEYWDGDIKWITPAELNEDSFYLHDSVRHITELGKEKTGLSYMPTGTVILSSRAPIGKTAIAACEMCCNQGFKNLICSDKIFNEYLYFFLSAKTEYLNSLGRGATFKEISKAIVENIMIPLPGIEDQKQIAARFVQVEDLIRLRKEQIQQLDQLVKSRFIELFGEKDYPTTDLISVIIDGAGLSYGIVQPGDDGTGDMGVLRPVDLVDGRIATGSIKYIDRSIGDGFRKTELSGEELLITVRGTTGVTALTDSRFAGMNVTRGIAVVRYDPSKVNPHYLNAYLNTDESQRYIQEHTRGATLQQINLADLRIMQVILPPMELQNQFAAFVEQTDKLKFAVQNAVYLQITLILNLVNHPWEHWASVSDKGVKL